MVKIIQSKIVPIDSIHENTWNPNEMTDSVFAFLKQSIEKVGFAEDVQITKDGTIINGEHRWRAMKELGAKRIGVKVLPLTDEEARLGTINFNATRGDANPIKLGALINELLEHKTLNELAGMTVIPLVELEALSKLEGNLETGANTERGTSPRDHGGNTADMLTLVVEFQDEDSYRKVRECLDAFKEEMNITEDGFALLSMLVPG